MGDKENNIIYTARDIEQYLAGDLSPVQMHAMEKAALDDPFLSEAMEGYEGMKDKQWNDQLVALRKEIEDKGSVAKVIPLHKRKNNWWKAVAAILILGGGTALILTLSKDKTGEKIDQQVAQNIPAVADSSAQVVSVSPPSKTESLNPTASSTEEIKTPNGPLAQNDIVKRPGNNSDIVSQPGAPQIKPVAQNASGAVSDDKTVVLAPPPANNITPINDNTKLSEELTATKNKTASKANTNNDAEVLGRQRIEANAIAKKEAPLNNFFTAQVVAPDNSPLPFTNISIKKDNFGTYADAKGMVRLVSTDSILNVEVRSVGYLPKTFTLRNNQPQSKIVLQEDEVALKDKMVIGKSTATADRKSRRATLLTDSAVNVEPKDGWDNYKTYVANNLDIPEDMLNRDIRGEVELIFDVKANGTISNIRVNKSLGAEYDEAAKRLILEGPQWKVKKGRKTSASVKVQF
ncbi:MAG: energy transducer TonB [Ferruginibacter sp.]